VKGTIKNWFDDKGFGFIRPDDGSVDLFVHIKDVDGRQAPPVGAAVGIRIGDRPAIWSPPRN